MTHLRTGRKVGLHLYRQTGPNPSDWDPPVGTVFTEELAAEIVQAVNAAHDHEADAERRMAYADLRVTQARAAERARIRAAIEEEIEELDPDGHMRALLTDPDRTGADPGHPGNAWWRSYMRVSGMALALACTEPEENQ